MDTVAMKKLIHMKARLGLADHIRACEPCQEIIHPLGCIVGNALAMQTTMTMREVEEAIAQSNREAAHVV